MAFKDASRILQRISPANETVQILHNPIPRLEYVKDAQRISPLWLYLFCVESYQELLHKTQKINQFILPLSK